MYGRPDDFDPAVLFFWANILTCSRNKIAAGPRSRPRDAGAITGYGAAPHQARGPVCTGLHCLPLLTAALTHRSPGVYRRVGFPVTRAETFGLLLSSGSFSAVHIPAPAENGFTTRTILSAQLYARRRNTLRVQCVFEDAYTLYHKRRHNNIWITFHCSRKKA